MLKTIGIMTLIFASTATVVNARGNTQYRWDSAGNCDEVAPNGATVRNNIDDNSCRYSQGSSYRWDSAGNCDEVAPNGATVRNNIDDNSCRSSQGSSYRWDSAGNCDEVAPNNSTVRNNISDDLCRGSQGSTFRWDSAGNCDEVAPNGATVRNNIDDNECRYPQTYMPPRYNYDDAGRDTPDRYNDGDIGRNDAVRSHRNFSMTVLTITEQVILSVEELEGFANGQEYSEILLPIKKQAARLSSRVKARASFDMVKNTLVYLDTLLRKSEPFLNDAMERNYAFDSARNLLDSRAKIQKLAQIMREVGGMQGLY